jgi:hypothetical protein
MIMRLRCWFGKHEYEVIQEFGDDSRRIGCPYCKKEWAMNDRTKTLLPWDYEFQSMYKNIFKYELKKPRWQQELDRDE